MSSLPILNQKWKSRHHLGVIMPFPHCFPSFHLSAALPWSSLHVGSTLLACSGSGSSPRPSVIQDWHYLRALIHTLTHCSPLQKQILDGDLRCLLTFILSKTIFEDHFAITVLFWFSAHSGYHQEFAPLVLRHSAECSLWWRQEGTACNHEKSHPFSKLLRFSSLQNRVCGQMINGCGTHWWSCWSCLDLTFLRCALKQFAVSPYFAVSHSGGQLLQQISEARSAWRMD